MSLERLRIRLSPAEGWLGVSLLFVLCLALAQAIDDSAWVLGRTELTDFLPWTAAGGAAVGLLGAKVGWGRLTTYLIGAAFAALLVPVLVGGVLLRDAGAGGGSWGDLFRASANSAVEAALDLTVRGQTITHEYGHFLLVLGLVVWATSQFAAFATFRHRRPLGAIVVLGIALVANMSLTPPQRDQFGFLVLFTVAALLLLVRLHAVDEQASWVRRRIGDPIAVSSMYLRGGTAFVVASVLGALVLTGTASSAPLAGAWSGIDSWLADAGRGLQRYFPFVQSVRGPVVVDFGPTAPITGRWVTDSAVAIQVRVPAGDRTKYYWSATTYDQFDGSGWSQSSGAQQARDPGAEILAGTADAPISEGHVAIGVSVQPVGYHGSSVVTPGTVLAVDRATQLTTLGPGGFFEALDTVPGNVSYQVTALVPILGDANPNGLTQNRLRAAGRDYPPEVAAAYLDVPPGVLGPESLTILSVAKARMAQNTPYDLAKGLVDELHSSAFTYATDVTDVDCGGRSIVECFAHYRRGYCQYYASTMTMLLRFEGVPARLVQGFLPGDRTSDGVETIRNSNAHAWVQVYFPGFGWVDFDPTGGNVSQAQEIPVGRPVPTPSIAPRPSGSGEDVSGPDIRRRPSSDGGATGGTSGSSGPAGPLGYVAIAVLLAVFVGAIAFAAYRRSPRDLTPAQAYRGITRLAARLGFAPRPTQTIYEYAEALGDVLPVARPDLRTVARATVEVAYGRHQLEADRVRAVREAAATLRITLLRLLLRRRYRWGGRRRR